MTQLLLIPLRKLFRAIRPREVGKSLVSNLTSNKNSAPISLSGKEAITGNADMDELSEAGVQHELFEGVFTEIKTVEALSGTKSASMNVLKNPLLDSFKDVESRCHMKLLDAAELWRKSVN